MVITMDLKCQCLVIKLLVALSALFQYMARLDQKHGLY